MLDDIKENGERWETNFYINNDKLAKMIENNQIGFLSTAESCVILWKRSRDFQIYYFSVNLDDLGILLQILQSNTNLPLVVNVLSSNASIQNMDLYLAKYKFSKYCILRRMVRINKETRELPDIKKYKLQVSDAEYIYDIMADNLDTVSDQLPDIEEIRSAISNGEIIGVRSDTTGKVVSLIWYSVSGKSLELKYWVGDRAESGKQNGRAIYSVFEEYTKGFKKIFLFCHIGAWAESFYMKHDFKRDTVSDNVYVHY